MVCKCGCRLSKCEKCGQLTYCESCDKCRSCSKKVCNPAIKSSKVKSAKKVVKPWMLKFNNSL